MVIEIKTPWGIGGKILDSLAWLLTGKRLKRELAPEDKEWREMADFVIGKTVEAVENWDVGPTFIFTDGSSLELYSHKKGFAWVLEEGEKQRSKGER